MSTAEGPLVVGIDSSTQSAKALVVDVGTGRIVATGQAPHRVTTGASTGRATRATGGRR